MTKEKDTLETIKLSLNGLLAELNALKASICVAIVFVDQALERVEE